MMSWWEREVQIWRLSKSPDPTHENEEETEVRGKKLVAKILVKGEANINSASLSSDGTLLAVATTSEIKIFHLRLRKPEEGEGLKVSKITTPSSFSSGARLVQFSPNSKWLCIIRPDSQIVISRIINSASSTTFHPVLSKPSRLDRHIEKFVLLGGLGTYDRTITQVTFSSNSAILAVSDLAGYIDTFVLEGHEDLLQPIPSIDSEDASSDSSDSESDSESDEEVKPKLVFGQHWTRNPSALLLPKLPSAPVVLSFRPGVNEELTNGAVPRSTRSTPNPVSHEIPAGEARLLVVTATTDIFEFEVLKGGLTPWSRRNPTSSFPEDFRKTLEQVRGCIWDVSGSKERIWLYSIGWLWMFDLSRDFPQSTAITVEPSKKRKRTHGAGGAVADEKLSTGISRQVQKFVHEEEYGQQTLVDGDAMDVDEEIEEPATLDRLRRDDTANAEVAAAAGMEKPHDWHTFKYRPILGIVEIGEGDEKGGPEVAIVERPIFEADLPPRYYGDQEWKDKEISW
jgi:U3 small nucleolar RNA-associated protein 4